MRDAIRAVSSTSISSPAPSSQMPAQNAVVGGWASRCATAASGESRDSGMCGATRKTKPPNDEQDVQDAAGVGDAVESLGHGNLRGAGTGRRRACGRAARARPPPDRHPFHPEWTRSPLRGDAAGAAERR